MLRETGLRDYLVLLSICQTCRYKGVSFLHFLLSRHETSTCSARASIGSDHRPPLNSTRFTHPHLDSLHKKRLAHHTGESQRYREASTS